MNYGIRPTRNKGKAEWFDKGSCRWCSRSFGPLEVFWSPGNGWFDDFLSHIAISILIVTCILVPQMILPIAISAIIACCIP